MKYIIMADGKGKRWNNHGGIPKHFVKIDDERIIERTIRLLKENDSNKEIIVTSHDKKYDFENATRYEPKNNILEIDRFTEELIEDDICFLYGDCYYSEESIKNIINNKNDSILFFGNKKSIVAIKISNSKLFRKHVNNVKQAYLDKKIDTCKGWQVYYSFKNMLFDNKVIGEDFIFLEDLTTDVNSYEEYQDLMKAYAGEKK